jgi:hypothetical protein
MPSSHELDAHRQGLSARQTFAHAVTARRSHIRPRRSCAIGAGKPGSPAIWWTRCFVTPRSSAISYIVEALRSLVLFDLNWQVIGRGSAVVAASGAVMILLSVRSIRRYD